MTRRKKTLLAVLILAVTAAGAVVMLWPRNDRARSSPHVGQVLYSHQLTNGPVRLGPVAVPPGVKTVTVNLCGRKRVRCDGKVKILDETGYCVGRFQGGWGQSRSGGWPWASSGIEMPLIEKCEILSGRYFIEFEGNVESEGGADVQVTVESMQPPGHTPVTSPEDALDRLDKGPCPEAKLYLDRMWFLHGHEPSWVERLIAPHRLKVECRRLLKLGAPVRATVGEVIRPRSDWNEPFHFSVGVMLDANRDIGFSNFDYDPQWYYDLGRDIRTSGRHTLLPYVEFTCTNGGPEKTVYWTRRWLGPAVEIEVVEQLPAGVLRAVSNPDMDANMRSCFQIDAKQSATKGSYPYWTFTLVKPLPMALACRLYVSVDGAEPVAAWPDDKGRRDPRSYMYRKAGSVSRYPSDALCNFTFEAIRELGKPGKHMARWILRPDEDSALLAPDCVEYWGGEYSTPDLPYEYVPNPHPN